MSGRTEHRLPAVDIARTFALSQMVVFHLARDLEPFGLIAHGTTAAGAWAIYARAIDAAFLFRSGISLVLAHAGGLRRAAWLHRLLVVLAAAGLVTVVTYAVFPSRFIYFGILHAIAAASLLGLPFVFAPAWVTVVAAVSVLGAYALIGRAVFSSPWLAWTGLSAGVRPSLDLLPLVPWLAPFLLGIAFARLVDLRRHDVAWQRWLPVQAIAWPGRHSLPVYLLHQPVLLAAVWAATLWLP